MTEKDMLEFVKENAEALLDNHLNVKIVFIGNNPPHDDYAINFIKPINGFTNSREYADKVMAASMAAREILVKVEKKQKKKKSAKRKTKRK